MMMHTTKNHGSSWMSVLRTRFRLYRLCGWSAFDAWCAVIPAPMRRWSLALGVWLS